MGDSFLFRLGLLLQPRPLTPLIPTYGLFRLNIKVQHKVTHIVGQTHQFPGNTFFSAFLLDLFSFCKYSFLSQYNNSSII